jgi:hypothetical protein
MLALASLIYLAGGAAMYFGLPSSEFMTKAFVSVQDRDVTAAAPGELTPSSPDTADVTGDQAGESYNGFTLITSSETAAANLLDMNGTIVHRWKMLTHRPWRRSENVREPLPTETV